MRLRFLCGAAFALASCATDPRDIAREPHLTPVGSGLHFYDDQLPVGALRTASLGPDMHLDENRVNLFKDVRAMGVGDVVTVNIAMDDRAILGNSTDRSRQSTINSTWKFLLDLVPTIGGTSEKKQIGRLAERHQREERDAGARDDQPVRANPLHTRRSRHGSAAQRKSGLARLAGNPRQS